MRTTRRCSVSPATLFRQQCPAEHPMCQHGDCAEYQQREQERPIECGATGFCGSCGTAGFGLSNRPNCVSTGVPNMKVTEYPGTSCVPRTSNAGKSPLRFPELEFDQNVRKFGPPTGPEFIPDSAPVMHNQLHQPLTTQTLNFTNINSRR